MTIRLRAAEAADGPALARIYAPAVLHGTASFEVDPPSPEEMARRLAAIRAEGLPWLVAERAEIVVGYAYAGRYRTRPAYRWTVEDSVYVLPAEQGTGIGRALLAALLDACTELGFRQMVAVIGDSASEGSIRLHRSMGFEHAGQVRSVGFKHGRWLDQVLMQRPLGDGDRLPPRA